MAAELPCLTAVLPARDAVSNLFFQHRNDTLSGLSCRVYCVHVRRHIQFVK